MDPNNIVILGEKELQDDTTILQHANLMDAMSLILAIISYLSMVDPYATEVIERFADSLSDKLGGTKFEIAETPDENS